MEVSNPPSRNHPNQQHKTLQSFGKSGRGPITAFSRNNAKHGGPIAQPDAKRLIVEVCCHPESRLSQTDRKWSEGCEVLQFTKDFDLNDIDNQSNIASRVNSFEGDVIPLIWISLPCTGGTPWTYINMKIPSARAKTFKHVREFDGLWILLVLFFKMIKCKVHIALEWPRRCRYCK